jgi:cyclic beta-1,2-glucan synthetase
MCDLVLLHRPGEREALEQLCQSVSLDKLLGGRGGVHLIESRAEAVETITAMAELVGPPPTPENRFASPPPPAEAAVPPSRVPRWRWEGNLFRFTAGPAPLPRRWSQVLTNGRFGWTADDRGTGHLWRGNAHENKLTPWYNDPAALHGPEQLFVVEKGEKTALFAANDGLSVEICYGPGFARWEKRREGRRAVLTAFVPLEGEERLFLLETEGFAPDAALEWAVELQMAPRRREAQFVTLEEENGRILAQNPASPDYSGQTLTLAASEELVLVRRSAPNAFTARCGLSEALVLSAGTGLAPTTEAEAARAALERVKEHWLREAGSLQVSTPDPALNHYLSFWGRYQTIACRLLARSALYQCGGAYGFRDQLQDAVNLLPEQREAVRGHILRCCARQYREGDVQHWWHPLPLRDRGVRTRISDDLLWLPWAVCRWVSVTGDRSLLTETAPYLDTPPLHPEERDRFEDSLPSEEAGTVLEHCERAVERFLARGTGAHGLPLMLSGDWNDGMDSLGSQGRGESVWLAWFGALVLQAAAQLCAPHRRERWEAKARSLLEAAEGCWDGKWYLRAFDDAGTPVGGHACPWCQIDSVAQSFSVFAHGQDKARQRRALESAAARLYDPKTGTVALLTPPFPADAGAGYVCGYPEGVRENGAQYTHAAVWLSAAAYELGQRELGWRLLRTLLPEHHDPAVYQGEPFVLSGDVSTAPGREGQAGWTWYTGAAGWFCRTAAEALLGLRVRGNRLYVEPQLPGQWPGYEARWTLGEAELHIQVLRGAQKGLTVNGVAAEQGIPLKDLKGQVEIRLTL